MYRDNRDGELYEDYESAFNTMVEGMDLSDYVEARDWDIATLLQIIIDNCPDEIYDEFCECEENFFKENFKKVG